MKKKSLTIKNINSIEKYLQIYRGIFSLTDKEIDVLAAMIQYYLRGRMTNQHSDPFASKAKTKITEGLGMNNPYSINTYVQRLKEKGAVIDRKDLPYQIHPWLIPTGESMVEIKLQWNLKFDED